MRAYIIKRLLLLIPTLFILIVLVFLSVRFLPGNVIDQIMFRAYNQGVLMDPGDREGMERMLGLDVPVYVQFGRWLGVLPTPDRVTGESHFKGLLLGSLGESLFDRWSIGKVIAGRLPVTIQLGVMAIVIGLVISLPVGIYSAIRQDTIPDYAGRSFAIFGIATPNFWLALMVMIYPALWWGWSPPMEVIPFTEDPMGSLGVFLIPSVILGTALAGGSMRLTRTMMLEVIRQDYIRTAWSKGLGESVIIRRHALRNAFIPIVTLIGAEIPMLVGGSVIMERIFNLPGLGRLMLNALEGRDYTVVSAVNLVYALVVMGSNLFIDLLYPYLDPRVRYS
jgi:peptide/nickel transport system permease protein